MGVAVGSNMLIHANRFIEVSVCADTVLEATVPCMHIYHIRHLNWDKLQRSVYRNRHIFIRYFFAPGKKPFFLQQSRHVEQQCIVSGIQANIG